MAYHLWPAIITLATLVLLIWAAAIVGRYRTRYGVKAKSAGEPGCPLAAEDLAGGGEEDRFYVTRSELIGLVDEALKARGLA